MLSFKAFPVEASGSVTDLLIMSLTTPLLSSIPSLCCICLSTWSQKRGMTCAYFSFIMLILVKVQCTSLNDKPTDNYQQFLQPHHSWLLLRTSHPHSSCLYCNWCCAMKLWFTVRYSEESSAQPHECGGGQRFTWPALVPSDISDKHLKFLHHLKAFSVSERVPYW